jgi:hypothetical protein
MSNIFRVYGADCDVAGFSVFPFANGVLKTRYPILFVHFRC